MSETKSLKAVSIAELELAISTAISALTGTEVSTTIGSFVANQGAAYSFNGVDNFKLDVTLNVGKSYLEGEKVDDVPF